MNGTNGTNGNRDEREAEPKSRRMTYEVVVDESLKGPTCPMTIRDESEDDEVESHDGVSEKSVRKVNRPGY